MKRIIISTVSAVCAAICLSSCSFLDVNPEMGLTDEEVFEYYDNTWAYFSQIYKNSTGSNRWDYRECWPLFNNYNSGKFNFDYWTPSSVSGREPAGAALPRRGGMLASYVDQHLTNNTAANSPVLMAMLKIIRVCNKTLENVDRLTDAKENEVKDIMGQAYFMRGLAHFCLARLFGGMPYIDHTLKADDEWDLARLSLHETYVLSAEDMYRAYELFKEIGKMRRDTYPGQAGHLIDNDEYEKPNGTVALVLRGRALLYAASPLANRTGNQEYWKEAAEANALALKTALDEQFALQPMSVWKQNFIETSATNENIWQYNHKTTDASNYTSWVVYAMNNKSGSPGLCPTQNYVDKFETKWGDPLNTEEDRRTAAELGHYNETGDPYNNRDPRLEMTIVHDGTVTKYGLVINMYKNTKGTWPKTAINSSTNREMIVEWGTDLSSASGYSRTGYLAHKYWRGNATNSSYSHLDGIRLAEVYMNYAEAVNEYAGPSGKMAPMDITAVEAVNVIRSRMEMPDVRDEYLKDKDTFRPRIHNERQVEFAYEGNHNYFDLRRWVDEARKEYNEVLYGVYTTEVPVDASHPNGRNYERRALPDAFQTIYGWQDYMNYVPIPTAEAQKMKNFVNAQIWPVS